MTKKKKAPNPLPKIPPDAKHCNGRRTRAPEYCKRSPGWGTDHKGEGRCKFHGGATLRGPNHPNWRTGAYSKYAARIPEFFQDQFAETAQESDPLSLKDEIDLVNALIMKYLETARETGARSPGQLFREIEPLLEQRRKLTREEVRKVGTMSEVIFKDRQILIMERIVGIIQNALAGHPDLMTAISDQIIELAGGKIQLLEDK